MPGTENTAPVTENSAPVVDNSAQAAVGPAALAGEMTWTAADEAIVAAQLGRVPRGVVGVGWRCPCGRPGVVMTAPVLPDGTPFPTFFYLTCPRAVKLCSRLEAEGVMAEWNERLAADPELAARYRLAHDNYVAQRAAWARQLDLDDRPIQQVSAGGMPDRVKCLHSLVGHALAAGPGINPVGDETVERLGEFWHEACEPPQ